MDLQPPNTRLHCHYIGLWAVISIFHLDKQLIPSMIKLGFWACFGALRWHLIR